MRPASVNKVRDLIREQTVCNKVHEMFMSMKIRSGWSVHLDNKGEKSTLLTPDPFNSLY